MNTNNIRFYGELMKIITPLWPNTHLVSSTTDCPFDLEPEPKKALNSQMVCFHATKLF